MSYVLICPMCLAPFVPHALRVLMPQVPRSHLFPCLTSFMHHLLLCLMPHMQRALNDHMPVCPMPFILLVPISPLVMINEFNFNLEVSVGNLDFHHIHTDICIYIYIYIYIYAYIYIYR